mmetsp:Transcript_14366/g.21485  ORF Transcript_14366/g.21485 Transcript_14366/m.21485 type:complete len:107 (+) Transcript_14366:455-775(+)
MTHFSGSYQVVPIIRKTKSASGYLKCTHPPHSDCCWWLSLSFYTTCGFHQISLLALKSNVFGSHKYPFQVNPFFDEQQTTSPSTPKRCSKSSNTINERNDEAKSVK